MVAGEVARPAQLLHAFLLDISAWKFNTRRLLVQQENNRGHSEATFKYIQQGELLFIQLMRVYFRMKWDKKYG